MAGENRIEISIDIATITKCVESILGRDSRLVGGNPLANVIAESIRAQAESMRPRIAEIVRECVDSEELKKRVRAAFREAVVQEAERIARGTVRSMSLGKEVRDGQ